MKTVKLVFITGFIFSIIVFSTHFFIVKKAVYGDGVYYYSYARSLIKDGDLDFANELEHFARKPQFTPTGKIANKFSWGASFLWLPFFLLADLGSILVNFFGFGLPTDGYSAVYQFLTGFGCLFYSFLGLWLVFKTCLSFLSQKISLWATFLIWLGSNLFFYTVIDPLNSHSASFFTASLIVYFFTKESKKEKLSAIIFALVIAFLATIRLQDIIFTPLILIKKYKKRAWFKKSLSLIFFLIGFLPQLLLWYYLYGRLQSPYLIKDNRFNWLRPDLLAVLLSRNNGLFYFSPILIFSLLGLFYQLKKNNFIGLLGLLLFLAQLFIVASWRVWWGGAAYGGRMFISLMPFFIIGLGLFFKNLSSKQQKRFVYFSFGLIVLNFIQMFNFLLEN